MLLTFHGGPRDGTTMEYDLTTTRLRVPLRNFHWWAEYEHKGDGKMEFVKNGCFCIEMRRGEGGKEN